MFYTRLHAKASTDKRTNGVLASHFHSLHTLSLSRTQKTSSPRRVFSSLAANLHLQRGALDLA